MNTAFFQPLAPRVGVSRPMVMNKRGNLYKMQMAHPGADANAPKYELWTTKEAVQKHFPGLADPTAFHIRSFAKHMYEKNLRATGTAPTKNGMFVTTTQLIHGDPKTWPTVISDPELREA